MARKSERTLRMIKGFYDLHLQGYTIPEIAKEFDLTPRSVYLNLDDVAALNGVSRDSLLQVVQAEHLPTTYRRQPLKAVDPAEFNARCDAALNEVRNLRSIIKPVLEEDVEEE